MTTILHVEDDVLLAESVQHAFETLGFHGTYLVARTRSDADELLVRAARIQLILSDMDLPDGTGLDVIRNVRSNPARASVPIVILSGDTTPDRVDSAYVLGANSYVGKAARGRSLGETIRALYAHWLRDARLPSSPATTRTQQYLARTGMLRTRKATVYMQIAERLGPDHGLFWMDLALRESNLANICAFLAGELAHHELSDAVLDEAEAAQRVQLRELDDLAREPVLTQEDAENYLFAIVANLRIGIVEHVLGLVFPNAPIATTALRHVAGDALDEMATWIAEYASDDGLRDQIPRLRADAKRIRSSA
jgi:DNA-binding response OmpR family regulator